MQTATKTESHYETATGTPGSRRNMKVPKDVNRGEQPEASAAESYERYLTRQREGLLKEIKEIESKT